MNLNVGEHLREVLKRRAILLDTNFLSEAARHTDRFEEFFDILQSVHAEPAITDLIRCEFLAGVHDDELRDERERFLKDLGVLYIPVHPIVGLVDEAIEVTNDLCRHKERGTLG